MKPVVIRQILLTLQLALSPAGALAAEDTGAAEGNRAYTNVYEALNAITAYNNDLSWLLFELASQSHLEDIARNRKCVYTIYEGKSIRLFTDGAHCVVGMPVPQPGIKRPMINYCTHYNAFVERQADLDVQSGRYSEARKAYQLLRRYRPGEGSSEPYSKKLELLDRLEELEDPGTILEEFMKLSVRHAPQLYLEPLEDVWAVTVTNLMDMTLLPP